jgi:hypothetical protein
MYLIGDRLLEAARLERDGRGAVATVVSCEFVRGGGPRSSTPSHWSHELHYDHHTGRLASLVKYEPGQQFPVLYLPGRPSIVAPGSPGDSAWRILIKKHGFLEAVCTLIAGVLYTLFGLALMADTVFRLIQFLRG